MKTFTTVLIALSALAASTSAYTGLEARNAYAGLDDYPSINKRDADADAFEDDDDTISIRARDVHLAVRDAYLTGHQDSSQHLFRRWPPANHPTFAPGSLNNLPSNPHQGVPHHGANVNPPAKPASGGNSYFNPPGQNHPTPVQRPARRGSFKKRAELDAEEF